MSVKRLDSRWAPGALIGALLVMLASAPGEAADLKQSLENTPDRFEPDDTRLEATWLGVGGAEQSHTHHTQDDQDWFYFLGRGPITGGSEGEGEGEGEGEIQQIVTVETTNLGPFGDTYIEVFSLNPFSGQLVRLAENDDVGPLQRRSRVDVLIPSRAIYYVRIRFSPNGTYPSIGGKGVEATEYTAKAYEEAGLLGATIVCNVRDDDTNQPIEDAVATLKPYNVVMTDNVDGEYVFDGLPPDSYTLEVAAPGYEAPTPRFVQVFGGDFKEELFELEPEVQIDWHAGDYDAQKGGISLSEVLRVIQIFNVGAYYCNPATEDGYQPGSVGPRDCSPHDSDYNTQDWHINLSELLRFIQFYNSDGYEPCESGEDGFCIVLK